MVDKIVPSFKKLQLNYSYLKKYLEKSVIETKTEFKLIINV